MLIPLLILPFLSVQNVFGALRVDPLVHANIGLIRGLRATDGDYSMFLGIPYAIVDKKNPFGASLPHPKFEEIFEAYDDSAVCPQLNDDLIITGDLDCLHLNVFAPNSANSHNLLPVLVFIHGGFFAKGDFGSKKYGPKFLMQHNIVLVTINYRLGPYGFMCLDTPGIPGNQGLKDQIKALKWVNENIKAFGGDPSQVTIAGQSAGGAAVDFHLMYPGERLFNKAILQSGVALTPARVIKSNDMTPLLLAENLGLETNDLNEALAFLSEIDTHLIIQSSIDLGLEFKACVEKPFDSIDIFISEHPANAKRMHVKDIPVLIGYVDKEFLAAYINQNSDFFQDLTKFADLLNDIFDFGEDLDSIHQNLRNFYVGDHIMTENDKWELIDFESDFTYVHPIQRAMGKYIESGVGDMYLYLFKYDGSRNYVKYKNNIVGPGAAHADELGYLFDVSIFTEEPSVEDQAVIDRITTMWTNFVKYGNPTPSPSELIPITWTPITPSKWHCLYIGTDWDMEGRPFHDRMAYWDLFFKMYGHLEKGDAVNITRFKGIYNAADDSAICPQQDELDLSIVGTLDCLRISVYVPDEATLLNRLPVMVWIHGGGFRQWDSRINTYGPKFLVRKGVVLVTFNYRLGPYGFMSLNRTDIPGNAGLRDQLRALRWVKDNIMAFGGDENNITLFGESAGAASVQFHMISGHSDGLFQKAIMQSGSVLCDTAMGETDTQSPIKLAKYLGLETNEVDIALYYLSQMHPHEVIKATVEIGYGSSFKPVIEHEFDGVTMMIKDKPSTLLKQASFSIPLIIGFNSRERQFNLLYYNQSPDDYFERTKKTFKAKIEYYFDLNDEEIEHAEKMVRYFYIGSKDIGDTTVNEMIEFDSDFTYVYPSLRSSRYHLQSSTAPVYLYIFDYAGDRNYMKYRFNMTSEPGAMHGDEIGYLFHQAYYKGPWSISSTDNMIIHRMTTMWTDFAKTSNPTPKATELVPFKWHQSTLEPSFSYAWFDRRVRMVEHPYFQRMAFWDAFFTIYGDKTRW